MTAASRPLVASRPPMGWNSWNRFACDGLTEKVVRQAIDAMASNGMREAGYTYVNLDNGWQSLKRDERGRLQPHPEKFPHGIAALTDYAHEHGLKLGLYSDTGPFTCGSDRNIPGSLDYESLDARTFAEWGIDFLKYDYCYSLRAQVPHIHSVSITVSVQDPRHGADVDVDSVLRSRSDTGSQWLVHVPEPGTYTLALRYSWHAEQHPWDKPQTTARVTIDGRALADDTPPAPGRVSATPDLLRFKPTGATTATRRVTVHLNTGDHEVSIDNPWTDTALAAHLYSRMGNALQETGRPILFSICEWGTHEPWSWAPGAGGHMWRSTQDIRDSWESVLEILNQQDGLGEYTGPGAWNDPDMLEVGNGGMSDTEYRTHFSLWAILNAPLMAGNDLTSMDPQTRSILLNEEVIAVNQDWSGNAARRIQHDDNSQTWAKTMSDGSVAVALVNTSTRTTTMDIDAATLGLPHTDALTVRDLWEHTTSTTATTRIVREVPSHGVALLKVNCS